MKSFVLVQANNLLVQDRPVQAPGRSEVLISVRYVAICHTDFVCMVGQHSLMRFPSVLGHELSGIVECCGEDAGDIRPVDRVTALSYSYCGECPACRRGLTTLCPDIRGIPFHIDGALQEMSVLPAKVVCKLPDSVALGKKSLTEPASNSYATMERADVQPGDSVAIIGLRTIGLLATPIAVFRQPSKFIMLGTRPKRLLAAQRMGATHTINVREADPYKELMAITDGSGVYVVLFCGGAEDAWQPAGRVLARGGRVAVEALQDSGDSMWSVPVFGFTAKQISYLGVCDYTDGQFRRTLELIGAQKIDVASPITHIFELEHCDEAFQTALSRKNGALKVLVESR